MIVLITFIGVAVTALDQFVDASDKEIIRQKLVNFWVSTAELSTFASVGRVLKSRYRQMKRNIPMFLRLYWFMLLVMFVVICVENHNRTTDEIEKDFIGSITTDFSILANNYYIEAVPNYDGFCDKYQKNCATLGDELAWRHEVSRIAQLESSYDELLPNLEKQTPLLLEVAADAAAALVIVLLAIPLSLSLLLSFNCTLWLLSSITSSSWKFYAILFLDAFVALLAPVVLLNIFVYIWIQIAVYMAGGLIDYSAFNSANIFTLIIGSAAYILNLNFATLTATTWFMYMTPDWTVRLLVFLLQLFLLGVSIYSTIISFVSDTWKAVHFDFSTGYVGGAINWAIIVDMFYSAIFFIPGLAIVLVQRWQFGQRMFLKSVQLVAEHPKGPIYAVGIGFTWLASAAVKLSRGE